MKATKADKAARRHWLVGAVLLIFSAACATTTVAPTNGTSQQSSGDPSSPPASSATHVIDVTSIDVNAEGPDEASIVITTDGSLIDYTSFAVHNPPSLVVDLPNARNAISQPVNLLPAGSPIVLVHAMQIRQGSTPILRLMFDLNRLLPYRVESSRNSLQILIGEKVSEQAPVVQQPAELEQTTEPVVGPVESVEERARNVTPAALTVAAKPASNADQAVPPSEKPRPATPEPPLAKKPIVSEVELPVLSPVEPAKTGSLRTAQSSAVSPPAVKDETPPAILKKPAASSAGKRRTREATDGTRQKPPKEAPPLPSTVAEQETAPAPQTPEVPAANKRLSLDFKEADLDDLLRLISQVSGLNVVIAHGMDGPENRKKRNVTVRLTNVEWRQALDVILRAKGLSYEQDGNLLYVGSKSEIQKSKEERAKDIEQASLKSFRIEEEQRKVAEAKRKAEEERRRADEEERRYAEAPRCTTVIHLAHMKASDMKRHLERLKTRFGKIDVEESTHALIISDREPVCQEMAAHAKQLDTPPKDPFVTKLLPFNYAKAADLKTYLKDLKSKDGSVVVDERSSRVIVKDLPQAVERMETLLKQIDIPTPQVLIEARIVEATRNFSQSLGIQWGGTGIPTKPGSATGATVFGGHSSSSSSEGGGSQGPPPVQFPGFTPSSGNPFPPTGGGVPFLGPVPLAMNLPVASPHLAIGMTVGSLANRFLVGAQLSVAENQGKVRTLSSPRVATQDNEEAEIKQGTQVPYTTIDSSGRTVVQFQDAFIKLKVKPHITPDGRVSMKVEAERSFPGQRVDFEQGFVFPINTRKTTTNIMVQNGSTVVIGGLLQSTESIVTDQVPFFGDIPILGWLFKRRAIGPDERVELLVFLTPSILQEARR